jgi:hypothetical protein
VQETFKIGISEYKKGAQPIFLEVAAVEIPIKEGDR